MVTQSQIEKFQTLMKGTILSLCQNVLDHKSEIKVEVFIGITLDKSQDFHFSVVETLQADAVSGSTEVKKSSSETQRQPTPQQQQAPQENVSFSSQTENQMRSRSQLFSGPPPSLQRTSGGSSMLERLMTQEINAPSQRSTDYYQRSREVSPSPRNKTREVTSSTPPDAKSKSSLSYSELLRSFGEMSRQDNAPSSTPQSQANSYSAMFSNMASNSRHSRDGAVNQAQVVIPINFAIHSSSENVTSGSRASYDENHHWSQDTQPRSKVPRFSEEPLSSHNLPPDSTFGSAKSSGDVSSFNVKVKQEVLSDEDGPDNADFTDSRMPHVPPLPPAHRNSSLIQSLQQPSAKDMSPGASTDSSLSSRGILMSLLCEKPPELGKRRGRPKKRGSPPDPPFPSPLSSSSHIPPRESSSLRDNRVLIGLTDYLSGFKEGDLNQDKPPRLMFSAHDIVSKTRKVVLLNSGAFSTVRMVHRSLQGMKASEIGDIMKNMTLPRNHPDYVGEYKMVTMNKVRQGRKNVGVFYKCPPEMVRLDALAKSDILLDDYLRFYNQVFKYDRIPQPQYFDAIEEASPFMGIFGGNRGWKDDPDYDPSNDFKDFSQMEDPLDQPLEQSNLENSPQPEADSRSEDPTHEFLISQVKTEKSDWESFPEESVEPEAAPVSSTQRSRSCSKSSEGQQEEGTQYAQQNESAQHEQDNYNDQSDSRNTIDYQCEQSLEHSQLTFDATPSSGACGQPVFPQPMIIPDHHSQDIQQPDED